MLVLLVGETDHLIRSHDVNGGMSIGPIVRTIVQATRNLCPKVSVAVCTTVTTAASHPTITCNNGGK